MSNASAGESLRDVVDRQEAALSELRRSRRRIAETSHAERRAIERDLHDGVQQHLVALAVDLQRLAGLVGGDPAAAKALVEEMAANVQEALEETRALAASVYPSLLDARGFASALRSAAGSAGLTALVEVQAGPRYPQEITAAVYWCCVEALSSASPGSQASVTVLESDGALTFEVVIAGYHSEGRLDRLRDRVEALDGSLAVDDRDGGSRVHGSLPLSR